MVWKDRAKLEVASSNHGNCVACTKITRVIGKLGVIVPRLPVVDPTVMPGFDPAQKAGSK